MNELFIEGEIIVKQIEDPPFFECKYKKKQNVETLVSSQIVLVAHYIDLGPSLSFLRFLMLSQKILILMR